MCTPDESSVLPLLLEWSRRLGAMTHEALGCAQNRQIGLLTESQESKSQTESINLLVRRKGMSREEANKFVRETLRHDFDTLRNKRAAKFTLGVTRMWCDGQLTSTDTIRSLNNTLRYVASDAHIDEYTRNLERIIIKRDGTKSISTPLSARQLIDEFAAAVREDGEREEAELADRNYDDGKGQYEIVLIKSFEDAQLYSDETQWCITHSRGRFLEYTGEDGTWYFCLKRGYEDVPQVVGDNCPLDEYGLSMIAVCVNDEGGLKYCTCRWNHDHGGNDQIMTPSKLCEVTHVNFMETFVPCDEMERQMSMDEYFELLYENQICVLSVDGHDLVLCQDREVEGTGRYYYDDSDTAPHYLYDDYDSSMVDDGGVYHRNEPVILTYDNLVILRDGDGGKHIVLYDGSEFQHKAMCDSFFSSDEYQVVVFDEERNLKAYVTTDAGFVELKNVRGLEGAKVTDTPRGYVIQVADENDNVFVYDPSGEPIVEFEKPCDNGWFDSTSGRFECESGHVYDLRGVRIDGEAEFKIIGKEGDYWIVSNGSQEGVYDIQQQRIVGQGWYDAVNAERMPSGFFKVAKGGLWNILNASNGNMVCGRGGTKGADQYRTSCGILLFGVADHASDGQLIRLYYANGKPLFKGGDCISSCIALGCRGTNLTLCYDAVNGTRKIYDIKTGKCVSDTLGFQIKKAYDMGYYRYVVLHDFNDKVHILNLDTLKCQGPFDGHDYYVYRCDIFSMLKVGDKTEFVDTNGNPLSDLVFDQVDIQYNLGAIWVMRGGKYNMVGIDNDSHNPHLLSSVWFDKIISTYSDAVEYRGKRYRFHYQTSTLKADDGETINVKPKS